jgi:long-chain acyl-CoA synthetase
MHTTSTPAARGEPRTVAATILGAARTHDGVALRIPRDGGLQDTSYHELAERAQAIARGLIALGVEPGDRVGILGNTVPEWSLADVGALAAGATVVPVYHTNSPDECQYVLEHSGAKVVFCEDDEQVAKITQVRDRLPALEHVAAFDSAEGAMSMRELTSRGDDVAEDAPERAQAALGEDAVATIVYTSGTTGNPKGCEITQGNLLAVMEMYRRALDLKSGTTIFMFLPLAHVLARIAQMCTLNLGGTLAFHSGDREKLLDELTETAPTHLPAVPRVFEKVRTKASTKATEAGGVKAKLFHWAIGVGERVRAAEAGGGSPNPLLKAQHALADKLVLSKVRGLFGPRLEVALTGAAPMPREVLDFFHACGVLILEGYGMSETTSAATLNTPEHYRFGTVGRDLADTESRIADDGEVLMSGPHIFKGYYRNEEATAEILTEDGWLHSGDLGEKDSDGYLKITGRKKDLIITSSGKNISPSNIESALRESRWVSQAVVAGDDRPYLVALLTLDPEEAPALAEQLGITADPQQMADDPKVRDELQKAVDEANKRFARIEQVKKFTVLPRDLSQETGELTPTMKVKRNVVAENFGSEIEELYGQ